MKRIIMIAGESCAGKDTLKNALKDYYEDRVNFIISSTSRPKRDYEVDGKDYYFESREEMVVGLMGHEFLEMSTFRDWQYGTRYSELKDDKINIGIFNPEGVNNVVETLGRQSCFIIYLTADDKVRLIRALEREENPDIMEIFRRYQTDMTDFADVFFDDYDVKIINNDDEQSEAWFMDLCKDIEKFVEGR